MLPDEADILLVQDSPLEVELMLRPLQELGPEYRIAVARDGEEALDYLLGRGAFRHRIGAPPPRVVLLDLRLARIDGVEVLRAVRASPRVSATPVVMLIPAGEPREVVQCYQVGANSCVLKPVDFRRFYETIQTIGRYWLVQNVTASGLAVSLAPGGLGNGARPGG